MEGGDIVGRRFRRRSDIGRNFRRNVPGLSPSCLSLESEKSTEEFLAIALAPLSSIRRAALLLLAIDDALNGGRRAEPEDAGAIRDASDVRRT